MIANVEFDNLTPVRELGRGATGVVMVMRDASGTLFAVKTLAPSLAQVAEFRERFRGEAAILEGLDHPNIARLRGYHETDATAAIAMDLVDGAPLNRLIAGGSATPHAALVVLRGSLSALESAHAVGVVHRDYKPANVIVDTSGVSRLVDFGIAAPSGTAGVAEGTPAYAAPEQWNGAAATPSTDVYASAAVLYECLTGRPPFGTASVDLTELRRRHMEDSVALDDVPADLGPLLERGLAKRPEDRYPSAGAFLADLESVAERKYGPDWLEVGAGLLAVGAVALVVGTPIHALAAAAAPTAATPAGAAGTSVTVIKRARHLTKLQWVGAASATAAVVAVGTVGIVATRPASNTAAVVGARTPAPTVQAAPASKFLDVRGSWAEVASVGAANFPQTLTITHEDFSTGAISGLDSGGSGPAFTVTGTIVGSTITTDTTEPGGGYTSHSVGTVVSNGTTLTMSGTFSDSFGRSGDPWSATRTSPSTAAPTA